MFHKFSSSESHLPYSSKFENFIHEIGGHKVAYIARSVKNVGATLNHENLKYFCPENLLER